MGTVPRSTQKHARVISAFSWVERGTVPMFHKTVLRVLPLYKRKERG